MNRFFIEADLHVDTQLLLTESVFHHWVRVLRAQLNDQAVFFNGQGGEYHVRLIEINKKMPLYKSRHLMQLIVAHALKPCLGRS